MHVFFEETIMVRHVNSRRWAVGGALAAILVGGGALVWHLLACTESPMAYSPSGKDLAFVTMEPCGGDEPMWVAGPQAYRLMVLAGGTKLRVVEGTTDEMLCAPAFTPDGKRLCYLRIALLSADGAERLGEYLSKRVQARREEQPFVWGWPRQAQLATAPVTQPDLPGLGADRALPALEGMAQLYTDLSDQVIMPVALVVRDAATDAVVKTIRLGLPFGEESTFGLDYFTMHIQVAPDGRWAYVCGGKIVVAVDLEASEAPRVVAAPAWAAALSPDGKVLGVLQGGMEGTSGAALGFIQTDGQTALYKRWERRNSPCGIAWLDAQTLVVLQPEADGARVQLHLLQPDGKLRKSVPLALPEHGKHEGQNLGALAVAPDGQHFVVAFEHATFFLKADGTVVKAWENKDEALAQPAFAPDGKQVAFKVLAQKEGDHLRATAIAFFTPEGKEISRTPIPKIKPGTTRPASQPTTGPGAPR
jgi:hypothetical protein